MTYIEISESKKEKLSEHIEKALHEMGKAMACVEQFGSMGERYGMRGGQGGGSYGGRYGQGGGSMNYRDEEEWGDWDEEDDDEMMMGQRRGRRRRRDSMGRYR